MHSNEQKLVGIVEQASFEVSQLEHLIFASGFESIMSSSIKTLLARKHMLSAVIFRVTSDDSLEDVLEICREFGEPVRCIARVDVSEVQLLSTLIKVPGLKVVSDTDFKSETWTGIFESDNKTSGSRSDESVTPEQCSASLRSSTSTAQNFVFVDPKSQKLLAMAERLAPTKASILLQGPTGTGKEVLANTLHQLSDRAKKPFIALNCAAMPEHLVEDMLFGHEKGAFTGANRELAGIFEQADGGTVFLDEIGEIPIQLQAKLLRIIQEKEVVRLGGRNVMQLDFRLIAATNKDLKTACREKEFREDLYYRISTFRLEIPALCDRKGDIIPLATILAEKHGCSNPGFTEAALRDLYNYGWPGNVRELDNVIQRAVVFANYGKIDSSHLIFDDPVADSQFEMDASLSSQMTVSAPVMFSSEPSLPQMKDLQSAVRASEFDAIRDAIRSTRTREEAAQKLGISPRTLRYKMAKMRESGSDLSHCA